MVIYNLIKCPNCGLFQITSASKSIKCQRCSKTKVLSYLKKIYTTQNAREATKMLQILKEKEAVDKNKFTNEFGTYSIK